MKQHLNIDSIGYVAPLGGCIQETSVSKHQ